MQRVKVTQEEMKQNDMVFLAIRLETKKSNIIFLSEGEDNLGTLAVAVPQREKMLGPPLSSVLLGDRNTITARILAENLANKTGKLALASIFSKTLGEKDAGTIFFKLFEKILKAEETGEDKT